MHETKAEIADHALTQLQADARTQSQARIAEAAADAITDADQPDRLEAHLGTIALETRAQYRDAAPGTADAAIAHNISDAFAGIVTARSAGDPLSAKQLLDRHRAEIDPARAGQLDALLAGPVQAQQARQAGDLIRAGTPTLAGQLDAADAQAGSEGWPAERHSATRDYLVRQDRLDQRRADAARKAALDQAWLIALDPATTDPNAIAPTPSPQRSGRASTRPTGRRCSASSSRMSSAPIRRRTRRHISRSPISPRPTPPPSPTPICAPMRRCCRWPISARSPAGNARSATPAAGHRR